ncbi:hypothetical protein [Nocardia tengchongensis]|uniref:hypothetical protein n=1 Tax=Nocardia tengchongensis TaxID=2055889 RepID=UPI0036126528
MAVSVLPDQLRATGAQQSAHQVTFTSVVVETMMPAASLPAVAVAFTGCDVVSQSIWSVLNDHRNTIYRDIGTAVVNWQGGSNLLLPASCSYEVADASGAAEIGSAGTRP